MFDASTEHEYRNEVSVFLTRIKNRDGSTLPEHGWPWGWNVSTATNYTYTWMDGRVWGSFFGSRWFLVQPDMDGFGEPDPDDPMGRKAVVRGFPDLPDMRSYRRSALTRYARIPGQRVTQEG